MEFCEPEPDEVRHVAPGGRAAEPMGPDPSAPPPRVQVENWVRVRGELRPIGELTHDDGDRQ